MQIFDDKTLKLLIAKASKKMADAGVDSPALNSDYLASFVLKTSKERLPLFWHRKMADEFVERFNELVNRRIQREPLQYILGEWSFLDIDVKVARGVLIPRPETETMLLKSEFYLRERFGDAEFKFADVGAGTGILGIMLSKLFPNSIGVSIDISEQALSILKKNISLNLQSFEKLLVIKADLLSAIKPASLDCVISNPPYIADEDIDNLQAEIRNYEPRIALAGGKIGTEIIFTLITQASQALKKHGLLVIEHGCGQRENILEFAKKLDFKILYTGTDMANKERYLIWEKL